MNWRTPYPPSASAWHSWKSRPRNKIICYIPPQTLDDIEKKWHRLNFRVLENTWRIEEPEKDPDSL